MSKELAEKRYRTKCGSDEAQAGHAGTALVSKRSARQFRSHCARSGEPTAAETTGTTWAKAVPLGDPLSDSSWM